MKQHEGLPMSEKSFNEWQKAFSDIEESIKALYKTKDRPYNKGSKVTVSGTDYARYDTGDVQL